MVKQSGRSCPERGARHMGNGPMRTSILSLLLAGAMLITGRAPLAYGERKLELRSLKDRVYRLESGPINRCPEKLGFQLNAQANELLLYPMEVEWEEIRTHVSPVVIVRGLRQSWESPTEEVVDTGKSRSTYAAVLDRNRIEAVTLTRIEDSML